MNTTVERRIICTPEAKKRLIEMFDVSDVSVYNALMFRNSSDLSRRIRKMAVEFGGRVYCTLPEVETIHDADGMMRQSFPNGASLVIDKARGSGVIIYGGSQVSSHDNITLANLGQIQMLAASYR